MAQYDVFELPDGQFVVDVQSDINAIYPTRVVIPLIVRDDDALAVTRLNPPMVIGETSFILATHLIGAVGATFLRNPVASLRDQDFRIGAAIDMLISGY